MYRVCEDFNSVVAEKAQSYQDALSAIRAEDLDCLKSSELWVCAFLGRI